MALRGGRRVLGVGLLALLGVGLLAWRLRAGGGPQPDAPRPDPATSTGEAGAERPTLRTTSRAAGAGTAHAGAAGAAATSGEAPDPAVTVRFTGRVLDARRAPVAGVRVQVSDPTRDHPIARTDEDGRFEAVAAPVGAGWTKAVIVARGEDGQVAARNQTLFPGMPEATDVGTLTLQRGAALDVLVRGTGEGALPARVLVVGDGLMGGQVLARAVTDAGGRLHLDALPPGTVRVLARGPQSGRGAALTAVPREGGEVLLVDLPPGRSVDVTVVDRPTQAPVAGARLDVWEDVQGPGWMAVERYLPAPDVAPTDDAGHTRLLGLGEGERLRLIVRADGYPSAGHPQAFGGQPVAQVAPEDKALRIELEPARTLRFPLTGAEGPVPPDGTVVTLAAMVGSVETTLPPTARVEDGELVGEGFGPGYVGGLATTPDGRIARLACRDDTDVGLETSFRPARTVTVRARHADGTPAAGLWAVVKNQGNHALHAPVPVDERGVAVITGLYGERAEVYVKDSPRGWTDRRVGTFDLRVAGGEVEVIVEPLRRAILVVMLGDRPGLPARYQLHVPDVGEVEPLREDPATGEVEFAWRPPPGGAAVEASLDAEGYVHGTGSLRAGAGAEPDRVTVRLEPAGALVARIALPEDKHVQLLLQRLEPETQGWARASAARTPPQGVDPGGMLRFQGLLGGRYRLVEGATGRASAAVEVVADAAPAEITFDLSRLGRARGRVEVPEGVDPTTVTVRMRGTEVDLGAERPHGTWATAGVHDGGRFSIRVPGDREVTLEAVHPFLHPAPEGGRVRVREARDDLVLRLVPGPTVVARFDPAPVLPRHLQRDPKLRVLLYRGAARGEPAETRQGEFRDGLLRVGGFAPGTWTLWIDVPDAAPVVRPDLVVGEGTTDLGTIATSPGATLRLRVLVKPGEAVPRLGLSATQDGPPSYQRWMSSHGEEVIELRGLGPGTFHVESYAQMGALGRDLDEEVVSDGAGVIERTLDLTR